MAYREVALNGNLTEAQQSDFLKDLWGRNPDKFVTYLGVGWGYAKCVVL